MTNSVVAPPQAVPGPSTIGEPSAVPNLHQVPEELAKGRWVVYAHEWLPDGIDVGAWKDAVSALCEVAGVSVAITTDIRERATVVMNAAAMPTLAQIEASVAAIEKYRVRS